jgi:hypothetical protein
LIGADKFSHFLGSAFYILCEIVITADDSYHHLPLLTQNSLYGPTWSNGTLGKARWQIRFIFPSNTTKKLIEIMDDPNHFKIRSSKRTWSIGKMECWNNGSLKKEFFILPFFHRSTIPESRT